MNTHTHIHIQGCSAHFSSLMGYQYHQKRCGGELSDDEKPVFLCQHCGKSYRSKAGRDYHVRTEHSPPITTTISSANSKDTTDTNNNTGKERVRSWKRGFFLDVITWSSQHVPMFSLSYPLSRWSLKNFPQWARKSTVSRRGRTGKRSHHPAIPRKRKEHPGMSTGGKKRRGRETRKKQHRMKAKAMTLNGPPVAEWGVGQLRWPCSTCKR